MKSETVKIKILSEYAACLKALSDETRLKIVLLLLESGELCVCELETALSLPQHKISRHLAILRGRGLVSNRRAGTWVYYSLSTGFKSGEAALCGALKNLAGKSGIRSALKKKHNCARLRDACGLRQLVLPWPAEHVAKVPGSHGGEIPPAGDDATLDGDRNKGPGNAGPRCPADRRGRTY